MARAERKSSRVADTAAAAPAMSSDSQALIAAALLEKGLKGFRRFVGRPNNTDRLFLRSADCHELSYCGLKSTFGALFTVI